MIDTLVLFGAGGDLAGRLLLPALAALRADEPGCDIRVIGSGEQAWTSEEFATHVQRRLAVHAPAVDPGVLAAELDYRQADVTDPAAVGAVLDLAGDRPVVVYLALPTRLMLAAVRAVREHGLPAGSRIAVEKPFGTDAAGAVELNAAFDGLDACRVDHVLAMTAVRELPRIDGAAVAQLDLLFEETLALEGRASFYDRAGALRDVMQNHLAILLCAIVSPEPAGRADVLRAVRPPVVAATRRARYTAGRLADGREVPDYTAEPGVDAARSTETFAEVVVEVDLPPWADTRIVLRAGKALATRRRGVVIRYRSGETRWLDLDDPESTAAAEPAAYRRIVGELLAGGSSFAIGAAEAELEWDVFTGVLDAWAADEVPLTTYVAGSSGP